MDRLNKIPKKNKDLAWRIIDGEAVVIPLENQPKQGEKVEVFNETGTMIWELIDGKKSITDIIEKIICDYDAGYEKIKADIIGFLNELCQEKLIYF